ncbi:hypothetical protein B0H13DRAFT_1907380 [Mycena leptocephala]|nr:hypothetical protein B0H13DRAFT_1907380 [Mycena leptocephala]
MHARGQQKGISVARSPLHMDRVHIRKIHPAPAPPPCSGRRARNRIRREMFASSGGAERRPLPAQREHKALDHGAMAVPSSTCSDSKTTPTTQYGSGPRNVTGGYQKAPPQHACYGEITPELVQIICERVEKMGEHGGGAVQLSGA